MTSRDQTFECGLNLTKAIKQVGYSQPDAEQYEELSTEIGRMIEAHLVAFASWQVRR